MNDSETTKRKIREFVMEEAQSKGITDIGDGDSLTEAGIVDSLGIFRLVSFLEESFGLRIGDEEIVHDNFLTISDIEQFVSAKLASKSAKASTR